MTHDELREKVARSMRDAGMTDSTLTNLADAAIRIALEAAAGVAVDRQNDEYKRSLIQTSNMSRAKARARSAAVGEVVSAIRALMGPRS